ncbi:MAG: phosphodiester glycosidase family protein [Flavobacteriales bacterium]
MNRKIWVFPVLLILFSLLSMAPVSNGPDWKKLDSGLEYLLIDAPVKSSHNNSKIDVLRFDPKKFKLNLLCAAEKKSKGKNIDDWCKQNAALAGVNAGMFKLEGSCDVSTGYMKNGAYINNPSLNLSYKLVLAFNAKDSSVAPIQLIDLTCQDWNKLRDKYNCFSQGIRMMDCDGKNTWQLQEKKWSVVTIAEDKSGNMLFIFCRSPYRMHDYINMLKKLPLNLKKMMYLEGGPEASFYLNTGDTIVQKYGSYETDFNENDDNSNYWSIPNVLALTKIVVNQ